nr:XF1762 family protein [Deinococcus ficus]
MNDGAAVVGVVMVGRPVARGYDDGTTLEVTRLCTTGAANAASMLYGAAWRAAKALGYRRMFTYTLAQEHGYSLTASGWRRLGPAGGGEWNAPSRHRLPVRQPGVKTLWQAPELP